MGGFFKSLLSSLDCCEREVENIFHFRGKVRIETPRKNSHNRCNRFHNKELECDCDCECNCSKQ